MYRMPEKKYPGFFTPFRFASFHFILFLWKLNSFMWIYEETLCLQPRRYVSISLHLHLYSTPISIKVASEKQKNYARSMFNGPRCIIVASQVNCVPAMSLNLESKRCWRFYATSAERQDNVFQNTESYCRLFNLIKTVIWGALICFIEITGVCFPTGSLKFLINRKVWYSLEMRTLICIPLLYN